MPAALATARTFARTENGRRLLRYTMVSVISVAVSQVALAVAYGGLHWSARIANVFAVCVGTVPSYELNRKWAWGKRGKSHLMKEVVPFWVLAFIGLAFSTWCADFADTWAQDHLSSHGLKTLVVMAAALGAFGVLWVAKFVIFNTVLFRAHPEDLADVPALDGRTGIPG